MIFQLLGHQTFLESLPEKFRPLPNRKNIVVTRNATYDVPGDVELHTSLEEAIAANNANTLMIIGGGEIFKQTLGICNRLYITHVAQFVDGDAFYPEIDPAIWKETEREDHEGYSFVTYERK